MAKKKAKAKPEAKQRKGRTLTGEPATPVLVFPMTAQQTGVTPSNRRITIESGKVEISITKRKYGLLNEYLDFAPPVTIDAQNRAVVHFKRPGEEQAIDGFVLGDDSVLKSNIPLPGRAAFGDKNQMDRRRAWKMRRYLELTGGNDDEYT